MPVKEKYWKNPEKHRAESRNRCKRLIKLGYKGGLRNYQSYRIRLENSKRWNHTAKGHKSGVISTRKHRQKVISLGFGCGSELDYFLYKLWKESLNNGGTNSQHAQKILQATSKPRAGRRARKGPSSTDSTSR